jgi:hypothetical protein
VAWADPILLGPNSGSFYLIPICRHCAQETLSAYGDVPGALVDEPDSLLNFYLLDEEEEPVTAAATLNAQMEAWLERQL